jgi:outer membrane immunogenic protein
MRCVASVLLLIGSVSVAAAADYSAPPLRGMTTLEPDPLYSAPPVVAKQAYVPGNPHYSQWGGFYGGVMVGYSTGKFDFHNGTEALVADMLRYLTLENQNQISKFQVLGTSNADHLGYGAFFGYNQQWEDTILGVELSYYKSDLSGVAPSNPIGRRVPAGNLTDDVAVSGTASMKVNDLLGLKGRVGWAAGAFLPYATFGGVIGRADVAHSAHVQGTEGVGTTDPVDFDFFKTDAQKDAFVYGWTLGGGVDMMLMQNVFVRAEVEYTHLAQIMGISTSITTGRLGAGLKF